MTTYYAENYTASRITSPSSKYPPGENGGVVRVLIDVDILNDGNGAGLNANDEIIVGYLPKDAKVIDARVSINKSLGATGIFSLGHKASSEIVDGAAADLAEDPDAFIDAIDGGGQAAFARPHAGAAGMGLRFAEDTQVFLKCTEVMDDSVTDADIEVVIYYVVN